MSRDNQELRKLWNVELDLLEKFKSICKKHNLSYCAAYGTLLGAVRHKGFIPWDDDIDLFMPWPDYKRLLELADRECEYPYFFQSFLSEEDGEVSASRLRRSDTTGFTKWEYENVRSDYDKGIFIDIFPLFNIPNSEEERAIQKETIMFFWKCIRGHNALTQINRGGKANKTYAPYIFYYKSVCESMSIDEIKWAYLNACAIEKGSRQEIGATSNRCHHPEHMWNTEWFDHCMDVTFENTSISIPVEYDKILVRMFGNWRIPVKGTSDHEMVAVDTETSWRDYDMTTIKL